MKCEHCGTELDGYLYETEEDRMHTDSRCRDAIIAQRDSAKEKLASCVAEIGASDALERIVRRARAEGAAERQRQIVAWLRGPHSEERMAPEDLASSIEDGEHLEKT